MKVRRGITIDTNRFELGDVIEIEIDGSKFTATAVEKEKDGMLFLLDRYLIFGYGEDTRRFLRTMQRTLSDELKDIIVLNKNGDAFFIPDDYRLVTEYGVRPLFKLAYFDDADGEKYHTMILAMRHIAISADKLIELNNTRGLGGVYNEGLSNMYDYFMGGEENE